MWTRLNVFCQYLSLYLSLYLLFTLDRIKVAGITFDGNEGNGTSVCKVLEAIWVNCGGCGGGGRGRMWWMGKGVVDGEGCGRW